ncbi:MAG: polymer-forming cytoskeletal protein [Candidatus Aminicenantales bacterium]|jgi:cytoskeletal protein CcmA (bactofilin family)
MSFNDFEKNKAREGSGRTLLTIIGEKAKIDGAFVVGQSIEIDCEVKGKLDVEGQVIIQNHGFVNADVKTKDSMIIGRYEGNMEASGNVEIKETGIVFGNIKTDSLIINKGGIFSGNVARMTDANQDTKKKAKGDAKDSEKSGAKINPLADHDQDKDGGLSL